MMTSNTEYRYQLEEGSHKIICPSCRNRKKFKRYVDNKTGEYLPERYGRCDREDSCGYHYSPYDDESFGNGSDWRDFTPTRKKKPTPKRYISPKLVIRSMTNYENNNFVKYLRTLFDQQTVNGLIKKYKLGTSSQRAGGCIFFKIDAKKKVRRGKIIVYGTDGHKQGFDSVHSQFNARDNKPPLCWYGMHLINGNKKPIGIVESEKTAIIASVYLPELVWVATGSKSTLKKKYGKALKGRNVVLYPDLGAFDEWEKEAQKLQSLCNVKTSTLLKDHANDNEVKEGYDIADYLIQISKDEFNEPQAPKINDRGYPAAWDTVSLANASDAEKQRCTMIAKQDALPDELKRYNLN